LFLPRALSGSLRPGAALRGRPRLTPTSQITTSQIDFVDPAGTPFVDPAGTLRTTTPRRRGSSRIAPAIWQVRSSPNGRSGDLRCGPTTSLRSWPGLRAGAPPPWVAGMVCKSPGGAGHVALAGRRAGGPLWSS